MAQFAETLIAQEYFDKNLSGQNLESIKLSSLFAKDISWQTGVIATGGKLKGDLLIQNYSKLKELELEEHEITSLTVINCPNLEYVNIRGNKLVKLDLEKVKIGETTNRSMSNEINEIIAGENDISILDLTYCSKIKELIIPDNLKLTKIKNLNFKSVNNVNLTNSPQVSLASDYEDLKQENEGLYDIIKKIDEAGASRQWIFTEIIKNSRQSDIAIRSLLEKTVKTWRDYFKVLEDGDPDIAKKFPLIDLSFRKPELAKRGRQILIEIIGALTSGDYETLVKYWNNGKIYNVEHDFDGNTLADLMKYLGFRELIRKKESQKDNKILEQIQLNNQPFNN